MNVLITFRHGFGDAIQLRIVLKHLQKYRPHWNVDVVAAVGKHSAFSGLCRKVYILERESPPCCEYGQRFNFDWDECQTAYADSPSTKAEKCLRELFGITPDSELCSYSLPIGEGAREVATKYIENVCKVTPGTNGRYPIVLIHFEGNTSAEHKNIPAHVIARLCDDIIEDGCVPVILDWDYRSPLADGIRIHCPDQTAELWHGTGTGDADSLAALTELSSLMIGIDSGPLHVAGGTSTPTLGVWTHHHPLHYFSHAPNVTHLVPHDHVALIRGNRETGEAYFAAHYRFQTYRDLEDALRVAVRTRLRDAHGGGALVFTRNFWVRADNGEQDLVVVQDVAEQDSYRIDELPMPRPIIVDVGAHIGCFAKRFHQRNPLARIFAVECCPENILALKKNAGDIATVIQAAVTYEQDVALLNAVYSNCVSTGGSALLSRTELERRVLDHIPAAGAAPCLADDEADPIRVGEYWADFRPLRTLTLEDLMHEHGFDHIDILKLDCEGSEFSILGKTPSLERIGVIVGEYHGKDRFEQLIADRFAGWEFRILRDGDFGTFWLTNPARHLTA
ncbi:MAG TPA: FkbM family methyltransferase [Planctomycetaceae bacterium]